MNFTHEIEKWYAQHKRSLPWRDISDPYLIWISEIILQQTRVVQGYDYYQRFVKRFPNINTLAEASEEDVLAVWQGLGYYSRARNLHAAAKAIAAKGYFPTTYKEVRALKGVGDYTAAAICSFAYGLPHATVDGNVYRVLSRYYGISDSIDTVAGKRLFAELAQQLLDRHNPGFYNQALMDFGALQCVPKSPLCAQCPLSEGCVAWLQGQVENYPVKSKRLVVTDRYMVYTVVRMPGGMLLKRRGSGDIWQGLYEPYLMEFDKMPDEATVLARLSAAFSLSGGASFRNICRGLKHVLTHRRLHINCYELHLPEDIVPEGYIVVPDSRLDEYPFPRLVDILFEKISATR